MSGKKSPEKKSWVPNMAVPELHVPSVNLPKVDLPGHHHSTSYSTNEVQHSRTDANGEPVFQDEVAPRHASHDRTWEEKEKEETFNLEEDLYSLMYLCAPCSTTFLITLFVFVLQVGILALILADVTRDVPYYPEIVPFPLSVPIDVPVQVAIAQFVSLIVATLKEEDIFISLKSLIIVGHDERVSVRFPGATPAKWWLANSLRFITGLGTTGVSFFFIAGSSDVLDIFSNFAAMEFISYIDNMVYKLARWGYTGKSLQRMTIKVESVTMENRRKTGRYWALLVVIFLGLTLVPLVTFWGKVRAGQSSGFYLEKSISSTVDVEFKDEEFQLPRSTGFIFAGTDRDLSSFDQENPPTFQYSYFSGNYEVLFNEEERLERYNGRPIYFERNATQCKTDPSCGMFYYCGDDVGAWVYTVRSLGTSLKELDKCEYGWLAMSPATEAYSLEETSDTQWKIWAGVVTTTTLSITDNSCELDSDCSLNGKCKDGECECFDNWQGDKCNIPYPFCPVVAFIRYGKDSSDYQVSSPLELAVNDDGSAMIVYERPVYFRRYDVSNSTCSSERQYEIYLYTGRRWHLTIWCEELLSRYVKGGQFSMQETLHAFWDNILGLELSYFSELTDSFSGTSLEMSDVRDSFSLGSLGPWGVSFYVEGTFECLDTPCEDTQGVCGRKGTCETYRYEGNEAGNKWDNSTLHRCKCSDYYGGPFCQFSPNGNYAKDQFEEFQRNGTEGLPISDYNEYQSLYWQPVWESGIGNTAEVDDEERETSGESETETPVPNPSNQSATEGSNIFSTQNATEEGEL